MGVTSTSQSTLDQGTYANRGGSDSRIDRLPEHRPASDQCGNLDYRRGSHHRPRSARLDPARRPQPRQTLKLPDCYRADQLRIATESSRVKGRLSHIKRGRCVAHQVSPGSNGLDNGLCMCCSLDA